MKHSIVFIALFSSLLITKLYGQKHPQVIVLGKVVDASTNEPIAHAQIASYELVALFVADSSGHFRLTLSADDSVRISSIGYHPKKFKVAEQSTDSLSTIRLKPLSYFLEGVTIRGYRGILDPLIFPRHPDTASKIELNLPGWIGTKTNPIPPSQRELMPSPSCLQAVVSPISFAYSKFSRHERTMRRLQQIKQGNISRSVWEEVLSANLIAQWSQLEGEQLEQFIMYCNAHISVSQYDSELTIQRKVYGLLEDFEGKGLKD